MREKTPPNVRAQTDMNHTTDSGKREGGEATTKEAAVKNASLTTTA